MRPTTRYLPFFFFALVVFFGCGRGGQSPTRSPGGIYTLHTSIERSRRDPGGYLCVVFEIRDSAGKVLHTENTRASDNSRWRINWVSDDKIRLESSDIGTYHWTRQTDGEWRKE